ncbi:transcription factor Adf-1-like [Episyrphus balteatus]|uniref:transcription factor Adf-1-like n=1 Tax=Episyrphus balteatus TaxID=286459 RepID=UPI0024867921|nr:transcription factor Adf-1-like [Episyrphus balteatus]
MVFERELIRLVKQKKCLFQTKARSGRDKEERLNEWQRVANALQKPVVECKQRWRSLRDRFVREKKKIDFGDAPQDSDQQWEYYEMMKFLIPSVKPRKSRISKVQIEGAKIYLNQQFSGNFANISNSLYDDRSPSVVNANHSFDEMFDDTETTTLHGYNVESHPNNETEEVSMVDDEDFTDQKPSYAFKQEEDLKDDEFESYNNYPMVKISQLTPSSPNENQRIYSKTYENSASTSKQSEAVTTTMTPETATTSIPEPTVAFMELMKTVTSEINKVLAEEKDENDLFLECMAKKMNERLKIHMYYWLIFFLGNYKFIEKCTSQGKINGTFL